ncbi:hypothetical protein EI94DRAFT_1754538 [Lactarius quietus]|nr:hypothetical protein EI94DRAFT_1754538 [Lactarius quietus]
MTLASFAVPYCFALFVTYLIYAPYPRILLSLLRLSFHTGPQWIRRLFGEVWRCKKSLTFCLGILFPRKKNDLVKN